MGNDIKVGDYVYRSYSQTFWQVTDMYYRNMPSFRKGGQYSWQDELCVTVVKVLDKRHTKPRQPVVKKDMPIGCFSLLTSEWYKKHLYFQKQGVIWDLICKNSPQNVM